MKNLGDVELKIYQIVNRLKQASVQDVLDELNKDKETAYTTVMTFMKILKEKGFLDYEKSGKKYVYFPKIKEEDYQRSFLNKVVDNVFKGSKLDLVQHLVNEKNLSDEEVKDLKSLINSLDMEKHND